MKHFNPQKKASKSLKNFLRSMDRQGIVSRQSMAAIYSSKVLGVSTKKLGAPAMGYVKDDGFYESRAWKEVRLEALRDSNGECECCGANRSHGAVLHVDHIKPRYKHPELSLSLSNLQVLCADCNIGKGAWDSTDFRKKKTVFKAVKPS